MCFIILPFNWRILNKNITRRGWLIKMKQDMEQLQKTGTTTLAIVVKDGIIVAADKRATAGNFIAVKNTEKVLKISDTLAITIAGLVSDAQLLSKLLKSELKLKDLRTNKASTTREAANLLAAMNYSNIRNFSAVPGIVGFLAAGYDITEGLTAWEIGIDGSINKVDDFVSDGSGSVFAYGVLESQYKKDMSIEEGVKLAVRCLDAAQRRDNATGNGFDVVKITTKGVERIITKQVESRFEI